MASKNIENVLKEIKTKEYGLRRIETWKNGDSVFSTGPDILNANNYNVVVAFLILARYIDLFDFEEIEDESDIAIALNSSEHHNAEQILDLWEEISPEYPYVMSLVEILSDYNLCAYQSADNDSIIAEFISNFMLSQVESMMIGNNLVRSTAFSIINSCKNQLDIENKTGTILVNVECADIIKELLGSYSKNKLVFCDCNGYSKYIRTAIYFLDKYSNCQYLENDSDECFTFQDVQFDGIIYLVRNNESKKLSDLLEYVKDGGFCIAFGQKFDRATSAFCKYKIPLALDIIDEMVVVCKKEEDQSEVVRYGTFYVNCDCYNEAELVTESFISKIKNKANSSDFQILKKDDFRFASSKINYSSVCRSLDQVNFVWKDISDIITICDNEDSIHNTDFDEKKIINWADLSQNPFQMKVGYDKFLEGYSNTSDDMTDYKSLFGICRHKSGGCYSFSIPEEYSELFDLTFGTKNVRNSETDDFMKKVSCRLVTQPSILYGYKRTLRVNATTERPVCISKLWFHYNEDEFSWQADGQVDVITISSDYDENFVLYQLINGERQGHILVAPTKEEQHTYFINKRMDYVAKFQDVVDEMEEEVQKAISDSPISIQGISLKNFRRFVDLPRIGFSGVNVLVGGNNSGKSTLVKGLLLAVDNIKNLVVDNSDDVISPKFQYDANNLHDVHIGTFNRAYSHNALDDKMGRIMSFCVSCGNFEITLLVEPVSKDDSTNVPISLIAVQDKKRDASFVFNFKDMMSSAKFTISGEQIDINYTGISVANPKYGDSRISTLIRGAIPSRLPQSLMMNNSQKFEKLEGKSGFIFEIADELERVIRNTQVEYIYAHGISQKVLYNYNDRNDYMALTLHDLNMEKIGDVERDFICYWLEEFGIAVDYDVQPIAGEAYIIQIKKKDGNMVYLADMGRGASQLVVLIFRLAIIMHRHRLSTKNHSNPTIIIEEPEQNMHPAFQSKLANLFHNVHKDYGFNFIVETHSEYLVRQSQVMVAKNKYTEEDNPFKVYYFPSDGNPYEMKYRKDGNFENEFGTGFFDEANKLLFEII